MWIWKAVGLLSMMAAVHCKGLTDSWTIHYIDSTANTSNPDIFDIHLEISQLSRSEFAISGVFDIKQDLNDDTMAEVQLLRSATGVSEYKILPVEVGREVLTKIMDTTYKKYAMKKLGECAPEAPQFEKFVAPLTARKIIATNCKFGIDSLPPILQDGFYKIIIHILGPMDVYATFTVKIEKKLF